MTNTIARMFKQLRSRTVLLPIVSPQHAVPTKFLNIDAIKQRTAEWEPSMQLNSLKHDPKRNYGDEKITKIVTYSVSKILASWFAKSTPKNLIIHHAIEVQQHTLAASSEKFKPMPCSLPKSLQMKMSTTYDLIRGDGDRAVGKFRVGVLQKAVNGIFEAERKKNEKSKNIYESMGKQLWWKCHV